MRAEKGTGTKYYDQNRQRYVFRKYYYAVDGTKKRKIITAKKRKDLDKKIKEWEMTLENGRETFSTVLTVDDVVTVWMNSIQTTIKKTTCKLYMSVMNSHVLPVFGKRKPDTLTAVEIQYWINRLLANPLSARTCNIIRSTWSTCFDWAVGQGLIRKNPLRGVRALRDNPKPVRALNREELKCLLDVAKSGRYYPFEQNDFGEYSQQEVVVVVTLAARTGMRRGEVFGLRWNDIDFGTATIHVVNSLGPDRELSAPKTLTSTRNILIDPNTLDLLKWWKAYQKVYMKNFCGITEHKKNLVFTTQNGTPVSVDNFRCRQWKALTEAAGLSGIGFHSLRHTHATLLIAAGVPVKVVSERLGHKSVALTMRVYVNVLPTMQQMAVEAIQKMNEKSSQKVLAHPLGAKESD